MTPPHPDRLTRLVAAVVAAVSRRPRLTLALCLSLAAASVALAAARLEYHTQRNDLLSADKPGQQRWQRYLDAFGEDDDMVVVAEGPDRARMTAALDAVAERLKQRPELFDRVFHRTDLRGLHDRALLFLSTDQIAAVKARVERMEPLLGSLSSLAWQRLNLSSLLASATVALESESEPGPADADLLAQMPAVARAAAATLRDPAAYRNPWAVAGPRTADRDDERRLTEPQYNLTPDGSLCVLLCRPRTAGQSFTPAKEANEALRAILADVGPAFPDVKLGLTGLPVLETDEMVRSDEDSRRASWLALLGVALLYFVVYRGLRYPLLTVGSLLVGTVWALGWATLTVGHLNILSATFAVMLIGMGDYGVLWVARFDEGRRLGLEGAAAQRYTAEHAGPGIVTAAATTALAFFATTLADFQAVAELGWIAGSGVLLCAISCLTVVPAALALRATPRAAETTTPLQFPTAGAWLPGLAGRPRRVLLGGAVLLVLAAVCASRLGYDHNLLNMQAKDLDSVQWEHRLIDRSAGMTWDALGVARTPAEVARLREAFEAVPEVGKVVEVASLVPADQEAKLPLVAAIQERLKTLKPVDQVPPPRVSSPAAVRDWTDRLRLAAGKHPDLARAVDELRAALDAAPADAADRLAAFDRRLVADLATDLNRLKAVSRPAPIAWAEVPEALRERYVGANGEFLVRAFARESLWDHDALRRFTAAAAAVHPEATGKSFRTLEGLDQMKRGFERAGLYALAAIVAVLLLDLRRVADVLLALAPLGAGALLTLGAMGLFGVPLNPANMIALPLVVGVGVDNGVHVLHDYRDRRGRVPYLLGAATGRGVLVAALTTVLGFGTLTTARHVGMASLGLALMVGVTCCTAAALVGLPALLRVLDERRLRRTRPTLAAKPRGAAAQAA
ncbi:MMPL family transporter [Urbifossiella limnaea]|uniref:Membrane transport protein mmpL8 n=1 Tax=Urbifossiella limnaea TaxID=2528023 RepID=A0A517XMG3_9BACT|nr:MMPL family transporter [Urbifossiella limnaea]QDU18699.1 Membrane transport protein mmpL8 [Urbifossiella limnaea]